MAWRDRRSPDREPDEHTPRRRATDGDDTSAPLTLVDPGPDRLWVIARNVLTAIMSVVLLLMAAVGLVYLLSMTNWGRERVRRFAELSINNRIRGHVSIGRLGGNLLTGLVAYDATITDSAGQPFVAAEQVRARYNLFSLFRKRIWVEDVTVLRPVVLLDHPPNGKWNYDRIFASRDTTHHGPHSDTPTWGDWVRFTNVRLIDGQVILRTPWRPSRDLKTQAERDSAIRQALGSNERNLIVRVPGGFQKVVRIDSLNTTVPYLRITDPVLHHRVIQVSSLEAKVFPFRPPAMRVRDVKGVFLFNDDSIWWKGAYASLPQTRAHGDGSYYFSNSDLNLALHVSPAQLADMRWIFPTLPAGRGSADLTVTWRDDVDRYTFRNATVAVGNARASGSLGISLGGTTSFHDTNVRFSAVDIRLLEQLIPGFLSPRRGAFGGQLTVAGERNAMQVHGDVTFDDRVTGRSRVVGGGVMGFPRDGTVHATDLALRLEPLQFGMVRTWAPTLPIAGTFTGTTTLNGSTGDEIRGTFDVRHVQDGFVSYLSGRARVRPRANPWFDVEGEVHPASLVTFGRFFPTIGLRNSVEGPLRVTGTLDAMTVNANLRMPGGFRGHLRLSGTFDVASTQAGYDFVARVDSLNVRTVSPGPSTSLTGVVSAKGVGIVPDSMRATLAADLSSSRLEDIRLDTLSLRATVGDGLATVPRLHVAGSATEIDLAGTFGMARIRAGEFTYRVAIDSLGAFQEWIPSADTLRRAVPPRPLARQRALARARADSIRRDRAGEFQRALTGQPPPAIAVTAPTEVALDTLAGRLRAAGRVRGSLYDFDVTGRAAGERIVALGNTVDEFRSEYVWSRARTDTSKLALGVDAGGLSILGFAFDTLAVRGTYAPDGGRVEVALTQGDQRAYQLKGDFEHANKEWALHLATLSLQFDTTTWRLPRTTTVTWGDRGLSVNTFELRNNGDGRVYVDGVLPRSGTADLALALDNFPISNVADILQTDVEASGLLMARVSATGDIRAPAMRGAVGLVRGRYNGSRVPDVRITFGYADRLLAARGEMMRRGGEPLATLDARLPLNLAFAGVTGDRLLNEPASVDVTADSLPMDLLPQITDLVSDVRGRAAGKFALRGTLRDPSLFGGFVINDASATITSTGGRFEDIAGAVRLADKTIQVDSLVGHNRGVVRAHGTIGIDSIQNPTFDLSILSNGAEVFNSRDLARARVDATLSLTGSLDNAVLTGVVSITEGVVFAPEPTGRHVVGGGDAALFNVLDTALASERNLFPPASPLLANLRADVSVDVHHNVWVRNRSANVEVFTEEPLRLHQEGQALAITGVIATDRGEYNFLGKRFQIKRGSAVFIGGAEINPTLQITGEYQVAVATRGAINIRVVIGGTLKAPRLSLESDAQPPKTQSELLSLLAFGQSTTSLLASASSSVAGSAVTMDLFGVGAQAAVRRLASTAFGVMVDQIQFEAGRAFGTDVFDITPADVPSNITGRGVSAFLRDTRFEAGKYINPRTYVSLQQQALQLGFGIDHRTADGWRFTGAFEPRVVLLEPTLNSVPTRTQRTLGGWIIKEWRY